LILFFPQFLESGNLQIICRKFTILKEFLTGLAPTTHLPTHPLDFLGGWAVEKTQKNPLFVNLFWKKFQFILGYSNFL
jgi:hypothetical protein